MRLEELKVENFRGIAAATLSFGPGLNVLHGRNELGKSTFAEAIRAALLVPTRSKEGEDYLSWNGSGPARVELTFESGGKLWRVRKSFGRGYQSVLEQSDNTEQPRFREVAHGSNVEGTLRDLLRWGIAPPGGRGKQPKAASYLLTALLGRQGEVQSILDASLANDKDPTGKALVTGALGVLGQDPLVSRILDRLAARVEAVFAPSGKFKKTAGSPLVILQEKLKVQDERLRELAEADLKGKEIEKAVIAFQADRLDLLEKKQQAEVAWTEAKEREERAVRRAALHQVVEQSKKELGRADRLVLELRDIEAHIAAREQEKQRLASDRESAAATVEAAQRQAQAAHEEVVRATAEAEQHMALAEADRQRRRAEVENRKTAAEARLKDIESAEKAASTFSRLERELQDATEATERASTALKKAQQAVEHATLTAQLQELTERQSIADRLSHNERESRRRAEEALARLKAAETALTDATARRDRPEPETAIPEVRRSVADLEALRAAELRLRIQSLRDQVREFEAQDARANESRSRAAASRASASQLEQEIAGRVLPTKQQIAAWRALEIELGDGVIPAAPVDRSLLFAVAAATVAGLLAALTVRFALNRSWTEAVVAGTILALVGGAVVWLAGRSKAQSNREADERRRRVSDRWTQEVLPSLQRSGLKNLVAYEAALSELDSRSEEARRLRREAEQHDGEAAAAAQTAAPLESRRSELTALERQESFDDVSALDAMVEKYGRDLSSVQQAIDVHEQHLAALKVELQQNAHDAVGRASDKLAEERAAYDPLLQETATLSAQLEIARQRCDPDGIATTRARLGVLQEIGVPAVSVEEARAGLEQAKADASMTSRTTGVLQAQIDEMRSNVEQIVAALGGDRTALRQRVDRELAEIETQRQAVEVSPADIASRANDVVTKAREKHGELKGTLETDRRTFGAAAAAVAEVEGTLVLLRTEIASKQGELKAIDRVELEAKLHAAQGDPVMQLPETEGVTSEAAATTLEAAARNLEGCDSRLSAAKGELRHVAGHVGSERLSQQAEAVEYAREQVLDRERTELAALRLLKEIRSVEAERTAHLGRTLGGPITDAFRDLTGGRYGQIQIDPELATKDVVAFGAQRELSELSVGTREQLATLIRLAIAAHLQTTLVLDDQLVHSDPERLGWFQQQLRESVSSHGHQIIVFTCRPADYLSSTPSDPVSVVDLDATLSRATS